MARTYWDSSSVVYGAVGHTNGKEAWRETEWSYGCTKGTWMTYKCNYECLRRWSQI